MNEIEVGRGYTGYFSGDIVVDVVGEVNCGDISVSLTSQGDGWNLIGNPYPSPIDWDNMIIPDGLSAAIYIWDHIPSIWGRYATYIDGVGVNGGSNIVPMMQGFFMHADNDVDLVFSNTSRIQNKDNLGAFLSNVSEEIPTIRVKLAGLGNELETVIRFKEGAKSYYENSIDALLYPSGNPNGIEFATYSSDNEKLVINSLSGDELNQEIPLYVQIGTPGVYSISNLSFENFLGSSSLILIDNLTGAKHNLSDGEYIFNANSDTFQDRFTLQVEDIILSNSVEDHSMIEIVSSGNSSYFLKLNPDLKSQPASLCVFNIQGQLIESFNIGSSSKTLFELPNLPPNIYYLDYFSHQYEWQGKWLVK